MKEQTMLLDLVRKEICNNELDLCLPEALSDEELAALYKLAKVHDMAHLVANGLERAGLLEEGEIARKFQKQQMLAIYRAEGLRYALEEVSGLLEEAGIPFVPLKGSVIRSLYPEPWMRTSCDIDVLVHTEDLDAAVEALTKNDAYRYHGKGTHDVSLISASGVHVELHFDLVEEGRAAKSVPVLEGVWSHASLTENTRATYTLSDEMYYFYHVAHMAKHFENGGCGVRPFLDLWILNHKMEFDAQKRNALLKKGGLLRFAEAAERVSEVWFSGRAGDPLTERFGDAIFQSGIYGTTEQKVQMGRAKRGGFGYLLGRIFLPFSHLKKQYPILKRFPWLYPFCQIKRWFSLLFGGGAKRVARELQLNATASQKDVDSAAALLSDLGL